MPGIPFALFLAMDQNVAYDSSIGGLVRGILTDLRSLVREEIALARVEIREQAGRARTAAFSLGMAAAALVAGFALLLIALATGIADALAWPLWAGFLTVALVMSVIAMAAFATGRRQFRAVHAVPEETVTTLKENSEWIAKRLSSVKK